MAIKKVSLVSTALLLMLALVAACGSAGNQIKAEGVWARPSMAAPEGGSGTVSGVFMMLTNGGQAADRLIGGKTDVASAVEIHETVMQGDVAKMQKLPNGLDVPAGGKVELKPGSYHVMLIGLNRDLKVGDKFTLELQFANGNTLKVEPEVRMP